MKLLLDTSAFIWWVESSAKLAPATREVIASRRNEVHVSAASIWEIAIKVAKGKLTITGSPPDEIERNGFLPLSITPRHADAIRLVDMPHSDPFDRLIVAQAIAENLTLVHADQHIRAVPGLSQLWAR